MPTTKEIITHLKSIGNPEIATHSQRFFKTGKGQYGQGDVFLGIRVPIIRKTARQCKNLPLQPTQDLLFSKYHEARLFALLVLIEKFKNGDEKVEKKIFEFYLQNTKQVNNWDLVDLSAPQIVGEYLKNRDKDILFKLSISQNLWKRRIAIIATYTFIKEYDFGNTLKISELLLNDNHDLIHKAVGWMLREVGNRSLSVEENFLKKHYKTMPRTMLRYAIEKFDEPLRQRYLKGEV